MFRKVAVLAVFGLGLCALIVLQIRDRIVTRRRLNELVARVAAALGLAREGMAMSGMLEGMQVAVLVGWSTIRSMRAFDTAAITVSAREPFRLGLGLQARRQNVAGKLVYPIPAPGFAARFAVVEHAQGALAHLSADFSQALLAASDRACVDIHADRLVFELAGYGDGSRFDDAQLLWAITTAVSLAKLAAQPP